MSNKYSNVHEVPNDVLLCRLRELANMVSKADFSDFSMRIPAEVDRDADLVICGAAIRIENQQQEIKSLRAAAPCDCSGLVEALKYIIEFLHERDNDPALSNTQWQIFQTAKQALANHDKANEGRRVMTDEEIFSLIKSIDPSALRLPPGIKAIVEKLDSIYRNEIESLRTKLAEAEKALKYYADHGEWSGHPWKLLFNSSHLDGDGWETAEMALDSIANESKTRSEQQKESE